MTGETLRDAVLVASLIVTLYLGIGTMRQNRRASDRTAEVARNAARDATEVDRERLGLDVLEASLSRMVTELAEERRLRRRDGRRIEQLSDALVRAGIAVPEPLPEPA